MPFKKSFLLYHWSPKKCRKNILQYGLLINQKPNIFKNNKNWTAPYICFSQSPQLSWNLSADFSENIKEWDLWMIKSDFPYKSHSVGEHFGKEYRIFQNIPSKDIWYVGTRKK